MSDAQTTTDAPGETLLNGDTTDDTNGAPQAEATDSAETLLGNDHAGKEPAEEQAKEGSAGDDKPVEYEAFEVPDGVEMAPETLEGVKALATEMKLTQEQAQQVVNLGTDMFQKWEASLAEANTAQIAEWTKQSREHPEFGGAQFDQNLSKANQTLGKFATPELKTFLRETGLANHPEMVGLFVRLHDQVGQDGVVSGDPAPATKSRAEIMYGN